MLIENAYFDIQQRCFFFSYFSALSELLLYMDISSGSFIFGYTSALLTHISQVTSLLL